MARRDPTLQPFGASKGFQDVLERDPRSSPSFPWPQFCSTFSMIPADEIEAAQRDEVTKVGRCARLVAREDLTEHLAMFHVEFEGEPPHFNAGQWMKLGLRDPTNGEYVWRPYTIASPPGRATLSFYVRQVWKPRSGRMTSLLWRLVPGDTLSCSLPRGHFTLAPWLAETMPRALVLIAGGTGLAPFFSQVEHLFEHGAPGRIVLCHGVSYADELGGRERFESLASRERDSAGRAWRFTYVPTVSRPRDPRNQKWRGHCGRVESLLESASSERLSPLEDVLGFALDPTRGLVMTCGYVRTIDNVLAALRPRGYVGPRKHADGSIDVLVDSFGAE